MAQVPITPSVLDWSIHDSGYELEVVADTAGVERSYSECVMSEDTFFWSPTIRSLTSLAAGSSRRGRANDVLMEPVARSRGGADPFWI
jgi:hypothetical protein